MSKSDLLFLLVLATIPIQLNKYFFPDYSYVLGLPIDYRAITIYFSDIVVVSFLVVFLKTNFKILSKIARKFKAFVTGLFIFNLYLLVSTFFSTSWEASLIFNLRVVLYSLLAVASAYTIMSVKVRKSALLVLSFSLAWQSVLIILQFVLQRSIGLWILGERTFAASTPAIAHITLFGQQFLRPYGTFSHPNVAGAFLVLGSVILSNSHMIARFMMVVAVVLTFSRTAFATIAIAGFLSLSKTRTLLGLLIAIIALFLTVPKIMTSLPTASVAERLLLIQASLDIALLNPLIGVGSNNFILELSKLNLFSLAETRLLQPVHNVFLLILTENGIAGLLLFTALLTTVAKSVKGKVKTALFLAILIYASFDHFFWTIHQGQLMFWLILTYIVSPDKS